MPCPARAAPVCAAVGAVVGVASAGTTPGSALKCRPAEAPLSTWTGHVSSWPRSTSSWIPTKPRYPAVVDLACRARRGHVGSSDLTHPAALLRSFSRPKGSAVRSWPAIMPHRTKNRRDPTNPARGSQRPTGKATARRNQSSADPILLGEFAMPILLWHLPLVIFLDGGTSLYR